MGGRQPQFSDFRRSLFAGNCREVSVVISLIYGCAALALIAAFVYSRRVLGVSIDGAGTTPEVQTRFKEIGRAHV